MHAAKDQADDKKTPTGCMVEKAVREGACVLPFIVKRTLRRDGEGEFRELAEGHEVKENDLVMTVLAARSSYGQENKYIYYSIRTNMGVEAFQPMARSLVFEHPFTDVDVKDIDGNRSANVVADNQLTRTMLHMIAMTDAELNAVCGNAHPDRYRRVLIHALNKLWD